MINLKLLLTIGATIAFFVACGDTKGKGGSAADAAVSFDAANSSDAASAVRVCYPEGIYGKCAASGCSNCLRGASVYQVCTSSCSANSDCGDSANFDGSQPFCAPLNPGSASKICVLTCQTTAQCPCGLTCRESGVAGVKICAETL